MEQEDIENPQEESTLLTLLSNAGLTEHSLCTNFRLRLLLDGINYFREIGQNTTNDGNALLSNPFVLPVIAGIAPTRFIGFERRGEIFTHHLQNGIEIPSQAIFDLQEVIEKSSNGHLTIAKISMRATGYDEYRYVLFNRDSVDQVFKEHPDVFNRIGYGGNGLTEFLIANPSAWPGFALNFSEEQKLGEQASGLLSGYPYGACVIYSKKSTNPFFNIDFKALLHGQFRRIHPPRLHTKLDRSESGISFIMYTQEDLEWHRACTILMNYFRGRIEKKQS